MDTASAASGLRDLLVAHENTQRQIDVLGDQITAISQRVLVSAMDGSRSQNLHLVLRLSVNEGVRYMYTQYQNKKWQQVQEKARSIISSLESDDSDNEQTSPLRTSRSAPGSSTSRDKAVAVWASNFCEFYRDC